MITSRQNPKIKHLASLRKRKGRRESGLTLAEGAHLAREALRAGVPIDDVLIMQDATEECLAIADEAAAAGLPVTEVSRECYEKFSHLQSPEGLALTVRLPSVSLPTLLDENARLLVAAGVQDPGNAGALLRVAEAAGTSGCVLLGGAEPDNPKFLRASMGSVFRLPCASLTEDQFLRALSASPVQLAATVLSENAVSYDTCAYAAPLAIALGSEGEGLSPALLAAATRQVKIPMSGRTESLNVAVAAGIILYEARKQWL